MKKLMVGMALCACVAVQAAVTFNSGERLPVVIESARDIPVVKDVDVVVVGGTSAGVTAAVAAKKAGASVYLVAPRPYLGEDIAGTLRLALEPGETPETELAKDIWLDPSISLPFAYRADAKSVAPHEDRDGTILSDGKTDDPIRGSVQFNVEKVKINCTLERTQYVDELELVTYRGSDYAVGAARLVTSLDGKKWDAPVSLENTGNDGSGAVCWRAALKREVRHVGLAAFKKRDARRMLLGEIVFKGRSGAPRLRVPTPIQVKQAFDRALLTNGVEFITGSYVTDVLKDGKGAVAGVVIANRSGRQAVRAKAVVDATGRATAARLAGVPFAPYPKGPQTFTRIVISGEEPKAEGLSARALPGEYAVGVQWAQKKGRIEGRAWECTLSIPMADGSYASFAEAEQIARDRTFTKAQLDAADMLFQVPPDRATGDVPHVFVLGGCAGLTAAGLRPLAFMATGEAVGRRAAADAKERTVAGAVTRPADGTRPDVAGFEVREALNGLRPFDAGLPAVRSEAHGLPVLGTYDVVVVGGGTGGAPAGVGASRKGAKTLLIEYLYGLGGVGTLGMIGKYWYGNPVGFTAEHDREVAALGAEVRACGKRETWRVENRRASTTLWFGTMACGAVVRGDGRVVGVVVATPQGRGVVLANNVVDATGNSDVAAAAGARCRYVGAGEIALQGAGLSERKLGSSYINSDWGYVNDSDAFDLALFSLRGRLGAGRVWDVSQVVGTRERRSIVGAGTVTPLDILNRRTFPDTIVQGRSDFDSHGPSVDDVCYVSETVTNKVFWANMPYRSLIPEKLDGIAVAGIGISVHRDALPLLRMQPEVQNAGYAAGVAAAMACQSGKELRAIDVKALQRHLVEIGAIPAEVLDWTDNARVDDETWLAAVKNLGDGYRNVHVVLADRERALPALRDAYAKATAPSAKLVYAHVLGILGDATGAETLARQVDGRDPAIRLNPKGLPAFGRRMSERDSFIVALGRTKSPCAVQPLLAELAKVDGRTRGPSVRALALACEQVADPALAPALAAALKKDGMHGWARSGAAAATPAGGFCSSPESGRCVRELNLARALLACGDHDGLARKTLESYAQDGRGVFALHARELLKSVK